MNASVKEREAAVSGEVQRAEQVIESLRGEIAALQAKLTKTEEIVHAKESSIKELEQNFNEKIRELEGRVSKNEQLVADREEQVKDLKSKLKLVKKGIRDMSSFVGQAEEALAAIDIQEIVSRFARRALGESRGKAG